MTDDLKTTIANAIRHSIDLRSLELSELILHEISQSAAQAAINSVGIEQFKPRTYWIVVNPRNAYILESCQFRMEDATGWVATNKRKSWPALVAEGYRLRRVTFEDALKAEDLITYPGEPDAGVDALIKYPDVGHWRLVSNTLEGEALTQRAIDLLDGLCNGSLQVVNREDLVV